MDPAMLAKRPKVRTCYVCGRDYGLSSYEIHLKQCKQLWIAQEELKPLKERRPVPEPPHALVSSECGDVPSAYDLTPEQLEAQNRAAQQAFENKVMEKCAFCGRTFNPERLAIHNRSCTAEHPAKAIGQARLNDASGSGNASSTPPTKPKEPPKTRTPPENKSQSGTLGEKQTSLAGSLGANRKQRAGLSSPLTSACPDEEDDLSPSPPSNRTIQDIKAKLDHWEKIALAMVQDIRDLKVSINQM
ncbi:hypothetical protein H310_10810 [Aphanomyces invadans]|uniref:C2HC/C3H-type domain-containing protein n=1 Tax=Aphanomyces invadans TaxID=157072 RepID=A0A024TQV1_9STRA|nr:hypothetical protein H310_10810 [Aphanomyces invadans]ETV95737.1 hypothetical protein H310_10810 [Aphanomyces invadans]|eukprot:XP_008875488.1 hypothetical protein H310_10810 [Aphanomyces invadans]